LLWLVVGVGHLLFPKGPTDKLVVEQVNVLRDQFTRAFPSLAFRGLHQCSLCAERHHAEAALEQSHINLFIPHRGFVFVAPARVDHYIQVQVHEYCPPSSFVEALLACPNQLSVEYRIAVQASNRGVDSPLLKDSFASVFSDSLLARQQLRVP
jgi:hypothetical protein